MNARMCDGNKAPHGLSRETLTLMGCVRLCYVPTFFFGRGVGTEAMGSSSRKY